MPLYVLTYEVVRPKKWNPQRVVCHQLIEADDDEKAKKKEEFLIGQIKLTEGDPSFGFKIGQPTLRKVTQLRDVKL